MTTQIGLFRNARHVRDLAPGEVLFTVGDHGDAMFSVLEGSISLLVGDRLVEAVGPGGIIGELVLVEPGPRSLHAVATAPTRVAVVGEQEFHFLVQEHPSFALSVMKVMAERLRRNDAMARGATPPASA
ncbi:MAG: Crp/Fnr family transcriptional regulator [Actinomycetes bacterium]